MSDLVTKRERTETLKRTEGLIDRRGCICTFTGRQVSPLRLRREDIDIRDIAHALALINRFVGHTPQPISVAQHSVYVCRLVEQTGATREVTRQALLHDASEAYLGDVSKWVKQTKAMLQYRRIEVRAQRLIFETFITPARLDPRVEAADRLMVRFEALQAYGPHMPLFRVPGYELPTAEEIARIGPWKPWPWKWARQSFLEYFDALK